MKAASFGFFRANKNVSQGIQSKLEEFSSQPKPTDDSRTVEVAEDIHILLRNIHKELSGEFLLDFTRMKNVSSIATSDTAGNEETVPLGNKRPAEFTTAIFDCATNVLAIHETATGVSASM